MMRLISARSNRGERALPPEAKISTPKKTTTAQNAENMSGPLTEVRRLRDAPGFCCAKVLSSCSRAESVAVLLPQLFYAG